MLLSKDEVPPGCRIEGFIPDANYINAHSIDIGSNPEAVWASLPLAVNKFEVGALGMLLFRAADLVRGDLRLPKRHQRRTFELREGEDIGSLLGDYPKSSFAIVDVDEGREFVVEGKHRYAEYAFNLFLEPLNDQTTRLYLMTRARFRKSAAAQLYFLAVRMLHDWLVEAGLRRLRRLLGPPSATLSA